MEIKAVSLNEFLENNKINKDFDSLEPSVLGDLLDKLKDIHSSLENVVRQKSIQQMYDTPKNKRMNLLRLKMDKEELDKWADILDIERPPIIFQGKLTDEQKEKILDFVYTPLDELVGKFKTASFTKYIINVLNPTLKTSFLRDSADKDIEGIVFHHKSDGRMCKLRKSDFGIRR